MAVEVKIPEVGESITEGFLAEWSQPDGAVVAVEDPLLVLETDKITMTVNAEHAGRLKIMVAEGETVEVGQAVATIDTDVTETAAAAPESAPAPEPVDDSPLKGDVIRFLENRLKDTPAPTPAPISPAAETEAPGPQPVALPDQRQTRRPMSRLRQRLAERLVEVQQTAAILTTFNEADMSRVMALRSEYKEEFRKKHEIGLGFMSFFVKATVDALKTVPEVNAYIDGDEIVTNHYFDIGVAVSTDKGLVVPVVRNADRLTMAEIEASIADLAQRAQERRLELSDLTGAVFTISNGGVFGSLLSTPILNPPGSAILGMHTIQKRPVAVGDEIVIRPMMYLAMSYDHRIIDGREAVTFLKRICECIEDPERMLLEI
jgi:2-oxoglutarate dehydrogenase E2 component (dihydrolipoamide succinyltransferase)